METLVYLPEYFIPKDKVIKKIISLENELFYGWDYGEGFAPSGPVINKAIWIYNSMKYLGLNVDVSPKTNGGLTLIFYIDDHFADIIINADLTIDVRTEVGIGADYEIGIEEHNIQTQRIQEVLIEILKRCTLLEHSMSKNIYHLKKDFKATVSTTLEVGYQYSTENVPLNPVRYVSI